MILPDRKTRTLCDLLLMHMKQEFRNRLDCHWLGIIAIAALMLLYPMLVEAKQLSLSPEEQQWLAEHKTIITGVDADFAPYEWVTADGVHKGIIADYLRIIEGELGIRFRQYSGSGWSDVLDRARTKQVDILAAASRTAQREKILSFSNVYIKMPGAIISTEDYASLSELKGKKVAVVKDYLWDEILTSHDAGVRIVRVEDTYTAVEITSLQGVDSMLSDPATVSHAISKGGFSNLGVTGHLEQALELRFAVRKDWPIFVSILNKAIASISADEHSEIRNKWIHLKQPSLWDNPVFKYSAFGGILFFIHILGGVITWNVTLRRRVRERTQDLRLAQQQLIQAEKMRTVGSLASGVAHEVKNPLAVIQMGIDFLSAEAGDVDGIQREVFNDIDDAISRANSVIMELLDLSREAKLSLAPGDINDVIKRSLHLVEYEIKKYDISVSTDLESHLPEMYLDRSKLQQVFINLLMNSVQAMGGKGAITIQSKLHTIRDHKNAELARECLLTGEKVVVIEVADNGPGIEEGQTAKLFDPFFTTKPVGEGTGLGLAISQKIIQQHHGHIGLSNQDTGGVVVRITLPIQKKGQP